MKNNKILTTFFILFILFISSISISKILSSSDISYSNKIALIPISGFIAIGSSDSLLSSPIASSDVIVDFIEKADADESVKAIILEINSPGGNVVASKEISQAVEDADKPVIAWIREIGTSGAYWIASASDYIVSDPLSITGSIGVVLSYLEFSELMDEYGVKYEGITSGKYKDAGSPFKPLALDERQLLQKKVDLIHSYFIEEVKENRGLDSADFGEASFYLGMEAKGLGLVDELGGKKEAIEKAKELANITDAEILRYERKQSFFEVISKLCSQSSFLMGQGIGSSLVETSNQPSIVT